MNEYSVYNYKCMFVHMVSMKWSTTSPSSIHEIVDNTGMS